MLGETMLRMVAGLFVGVWVARYLGPEQFGIFSYAIAFVALFGSVAKLGLDSILVRDLVNDPHNRDIYLGTAFWLKLMGALIMLVIIAFATIFTSNSFTTNLYIFIIASGLIFQSFEVVDFYFQSRVLSKFVSICKITQLILSSLLKIYLVLTGEDLFWFIVVSFLDQVTLAVTLYIAYKYQKLGNFYHHFDLNKARQLLKDSWPLIFSGLAIAVYMRIDQIMIGEMLGNKQVGLYSAAVRISEVWNIIPVIIVTSLFPSIINAKKIDSNLYKIRLQRLYFIVFYMSLGVALIVMFFAKNIMTILYGQLYSEAEFVLSIHIWTGILVGLGLVNWRWFIVENLQKLATFNTILGAGVNVLLNCLLIPVYGITGVAFATLVSYLFAVYFVLFFNKKTRQRFYDITMSIIPRRNLIES